jgi:hypothetical protein
MVTDDRQALLHQAALSYDRAFNPEGVKRQIMAILAEPSRVALLNQLRVPTLVVHGTADPLLPVMHGVHLAAHIRGSQLKLIPGWPIVSRRRSRRRCWRRCCRTCKLIARTPRIGRRSSRWRSTICCNSPDPLDAQACQQWRACLAAWLQVYRSSFTTFPASEVCDEQSFENRFRQRRVLPMVRRRSVRPDRALEILRDEVQAEIISSRSN